MEFRTSVDSTPVPLRFHCTAFSSCLLDDGDGTDGGGERGGEEKFGKGKRKRPSRAVDGENRIRRGEGESGKEEEEDKKIEEKKEGEVHVESDGSIRKWEGRKEGSGKGKRGEEERDGGQKNMRIGRRKLG